MGNSEQTSTISAAEPLPKETSAPSLIVFWGFMIIGAQEVLTIRFSLRVEKEEIIPTLKTSCFILPRESVRQLKSRIVSFAALTLIFRQSSGGFIIWSLRHSPGLFKMN